jgi:hypothetical protein
VENFHNPIYNKSAEILFPHSYYTAIYQLIVTENKGNGKFGTVFALSNQIDNGISAFNLFKSNHH